MVTDNGGSPCGACRQVLSEFGLDTVVLIADGKGHLLQEITVGELLPGCFPAKARSEMTEGGHSLRVQAVVFRHSDYGEADRLLSLYTRQLGKTGCLVKGARKSPRARRGISSLSPTSNCSLPKDRICCSSRRPIRWRPICRWRRPLLTSQAWYVMELLDRLTYHDES